MRTMGSGSFSPSRTKASVAADGYGISSVKALALTYPGTAASAATAARRLAASGAPCQAAWNAGPKVWKPLRSGPYQSSMEAAAQAGDLSLWQSVQALLTPSLAERSGRGTRKL